MYINEEEIVNHISAKPFHLISEAAEELGVEVYVIGGYVRDIFLNRPSKDIDVVAVGSGIELAKRVAKKIGRGAYLSVFKNFGTALCWRESWRLNCWQLCGSRISRSWPLKLPRTGICPPRRCKAGLIRCAPIWNWCRAMLLCCMK